MLRYKTIKFRTANSGVLDVEFKYAVETNQIKEAMEYIKHLKDAMLPTNQFTFNQERQYYNLKINK